MMRIDASIYATILLSAAVCASQGREIVLKAGGYDENVVIDKTVILSGEEGALPEINPADGDAVTLSGADAAGVELSNLKLNPAAGNAIAIEPDAGSGNQITLSHILGPAFAIQNLSSHAFLADNNWWGQSDGPAGGDLAGLVTVDTWHVDEDQTATNQSLTATVAVASNNVPESAGTVVFTFSFGSAPTTDLGIDYAVSGTASNPADHDASSGSVTVPGGQTSAQLTVNIVNDSLVESNETLIVTIAPSEKYIVGSPGSQTVAIQNDDNPPANQPPVADAGLDQTAAEGELVAFAASFEDPDEGDTHTLVWNFGDGSDPAVGSLEAEHAYADNGVYTAAFTVTDAEGEQSTDTLTVTVLNVAPVVEAGGDLVSNAGAEASFQGSFEDPGTADTHTVTWDFGDGSGPVNGAAPDALSQTHVYAGPGEYTVTLTVEDDDGGIGTDTLVVSVAPAPIVVDAGADQTADEGALLGFNGEILGGLDDSDSPAIAWNFGDGSDPASGVLNPVHAYADDGEYTVTLTVSAEGRETGSDQLLVTVENIPPTANPGENIETEEGASTAFAGAVEDAGTADTHTVEWDFGDGTPPAGGAAPGALQQTHTYADDGVYTATLTVTDDDGGSDAKTVTVNVANAAPVVDLGGGVEAEIGEEVLFTASASDPGVDDELTVTWDFGDGSEPASGGVPDALQQSHAYSAEGVYTVAVTAADGDGGEGSDSIQVSVNRRDILVSASADREIVDEGAAIAFAGGILGADVIDIALVEWNFGDGTVESGSLAVDHAFADEGEYAVKLAVTDSNGAQGTDTLFITVNNVAPVVDAGPDRTVAVGETVLFEGSFTDPGTDDTHEIVWNFGDGSAPAAGSAAASHAYAARGTYTAALTVDDGDGGVGSDTVTVVVENAAPIVDAGPDVTVFEGEPAQFGGSFTDPEESLPFLTWDFGDGNQRSGALAPLDPVHTYADDGTYMATLTVTDAEGASGFDTATAVVRNAPPVADAGGDRVASPGETVVFEGSFSDPGSADTHTFLWEFGDGAEADTLTASHAYGAVGVYVASLTVTDDDGGTHTDSLNVTVNPANVVSVSAGGDRTAAEGSAVRFNGSYSGFGAPSIRWRFGDGGESEGSLRPQHAYRDNGVYIAELTVEEDGVSESDSVMVTVTNAPPRNVNAGGDQTVDSGNTVSLAGSFDDPGLDDTHTVEWDLGGGRRVAGTLTPRPQTFGEGTHEIVLTVTDDDGGAGSDGVLVTVKDTDTNGSVFSADDFVSQGPFSFGGGDGAVFPGFGSARVVADNTQSDGIHIRFDTDALLVTVSLGGASVTYPGEIARTNSNREFAVFAFDRIELGPDVTAEVAGGRPLALLSRGDISLGTGIDVSGGAGGGPEGGVGRAGGFDGGFFNETGGGPGGGGVEAGAGFGSNGGASSSGPGGEPYAEEKLEDMRGGSGGGGTSASGGGSSLPEGGAGGGALQLAAAGSIVINPGAALRSNGGAGLSGGERGAGGGSGGSIILDALSIINQGAIEAIGGDGGFGSAAAGGGGAGGRIALYGENIVQGSVDVRGGPSGDSATSGDGGDGTLFAGFHYTPEVDGGPNLDANQGSAVLVNGGFADEHGGPPYTVSINWGDGSVTPAQTVNQESKTFLGAHAYNEAGFYTVVVSVTDNRGSTGRDTLLAAVSNDPPSAADDSYGGGAHPLPEGGVLTVDAANGVLANDTDPEGDALEAQLTAGVSHGTLTLNVDGSFTYRHGGGPTTADSFSYIALDAVNQSGAATVTLTIEPVNDAPIAEDDPPAGIEYAVDEGGALTVSAAEGVLANDTDEENDPLTAVLSAPPAHGVLTLNPDGSFAYIHGGGETLEDSFEYKASDGESESAPATVRIAVGPVNDAPLAAADPMEGIEYTVPEGGEIAVEAMYGVLANDTDAENDPLTAVLVSQPAHGVLTLNPDGSFMYAHDGSETTMDQFAYAANDGESDSETAAVSMTVIPVNDPPVAVSFTVSTDENQSALVDFFSNGVSDPDNADGELTFAVEAPQNGTVNPVGGGVFEYTPNAGFAGVDTFAYTVSDGEFTAGGEVAVDVRAQSAGLAVKTPVDFDRDGRLDVLWWHKSIGDLVVHFLNPANPRIVDRAVRVFRLKEGEWNLTGTADFDGDGRLDLLWHNRQTGKIVAWLLQDPGGTAFDISSHSALLTRGAGTAWEPVSYGDANGDGHMDILWRRKSDGALIAWLMNGPGNVLSHTHVMQTDPQLGAFLENNGWRLAGSADFNNNGTLDLIWRNQNTGALIAWEGGSIHNENILIDIIDPAAWKPVGFGDWNGDSNTDVMWQNKGTGRMVVNFYEGTKLSRFGAEAVGLALPAQTGWFPVGAN